MSTMQRGPESDVAPWYRQFWPWFLIALPATVVAASMFTIWLAIKSPNPMVVDDYARIARSTEQQLERDKAAAALGVEASLRLIPDAGVIELRLTPESANPESLNLRLSHPLIKERDQFVELVRVPGGWSASLVVPDGRRYLELTPGDRSWRLSGVLSGERELRLAPAVAP